MAASHRPIKGILKKKGSSDSVVMSTSEHAGTVAGTGAGSGEELSKKSQKWDEMNILATYHLADKDYGLIKIDEPNTPYHVMIRETEEEAISDSENPQALSPELLAQKLVDAQGTEPKFLVQGGDSSEDEEDLRRQFELKRKLHYSEGQNIKLARQLISKELLTDMEDEVQNMQEEASQVEGMITEPAPNEMSAGSNGCLDSCTNP